MLERAMKTFITLFPEGLENMTPAAIDEATDILLTLPMYSHLTRTAILGEVCAGYHIDASYWQAPTTCIFGR